MAFIRSYMYRSRVMAGDPLFGIKLPKIKIGKALLGVAGTAASLTPAGRGLKLLKLGVKAVGIGAASGVGSRLAQNFMNRMPGTGAPVLQLGGGDVITDPNDPRLNPRAAFEGAARRARRYRRMNVCNMRALTRAVRRVKRFEKIARQTVTLSKHVRVKKGARGRKC